MSLHERLPEIDSEPRWAADAAAREEAARNEDVRAANAAADVAELQARVAGWDRAIVDRMRDVDVPAGLRDQLLAALAGQHPDADSHVVPAIGQAAPPAATAAVAKSAAPVESSSPTPQPSRRTFLRWTLEIAATAASITALAFVISQFGAGREPLSVNELVNAIEQSVAEDPALMASAERGPAPAGLEVPGGNLLLASAGHRTVNILGMTATVHDLSLGTPVTRLFVLPTGQDAEFAEQLPRGEPPFEPQSDTNGRCVAIWRNAQSGVTYVLVIHGDKNDYRRIVRRESAA